MSDQIQHTDEQVSALVIPELREKVLEAIRLSMTLKSLWIFLN